jgi:transposase
MNVSMSTKEMGKRRCHTLRVVCMDMWAAYANLVRKHAVNAQVLFDRFHIVKHLNEAVDEVRLELWRQLTAKQRATFKGTRWLLLKNPWNLTDDQQERLSTLVRWNAPIVRAYYLKEAFQLFWNYQQPKRAKDHLEKCGGALAPEALQEIRGDAPLPSRRCPVLD